MFGVLVVLLRYIFQNLEQYRVYLSVKCVYELGLFIVVYNGNWYCFYLMQYQWLLHIWLNKNWELNYQISISINTESN